MTNEEALSILHCPDTVGGLYSEKYGEALNMAIKALEQEPKVKKIIKMRDATPEERESIYKYINSISKPTGVNFFDLEQQPCEDAVSRQAAIEAMGEQPLNWTDTPGEIAEEMMWEDHVKVLKELPSITSARPKSEWIPVSERLPEDGRPVLIYAWNIHHVVARYDSFRTEDGYKKCWVTADAWNGNTEIKDEVIAWMPLPEPYKAESEDKAGDEE